MPTIIEWDMDNGEVLARIPYDSQEEAEKALEEMIKEAETEGWDCEPCASDLGGYICVSPEGANRHVYIED